MQGGGGGGRWWCRYNVAVGAGSKRTNNTTTTTSNTHINNGSGNIQGKVMRVYHNNATEEPTQHCSPVTGNTAGG